MSNTHDTNRQCLREKNTRQRLFNYSVKYWHILLLSIASAAIYGIVAAIPTYVIKHTVDEIFIKKFHHLIVPFLFIFVFVFVLKGLFMFLTAYSMHWVGNKVVNDMRFDLFEKIINFPVSFYQKHATGKLMSHFLNDIQMLQNAASSAIKNGVRSFFEAFFLISFAFIQNWKLSLLMMFIAPILGITISRMGKRIKRASHTIQREMGFVSSMLQEIFVGIREIKAFNGEKLECNRFSKQLQRCFSSIMTNVRIEAMLPAFIEIIAMVGSCSVFYFAIQQVISGTITPGQLTSFIAALLLTYQPLKRIVNVYSEIQYGLAAAQRVFDVMDTVCPALHNRTVVLSSFSRNISFKNVSFTYPNTDKPVLSNISFEIKRGQSIGIIGPSGSGKSTLCDLLLGFVEPTAGSIFIDKHDLAHVSFASLREHIGYVGQRTFLFNDTVQSNVAYAFENTPEKVSVDMSGNEPEKKFSEKTSLDRVTRACKAAHAHEFITKLPDGYQTLVGENGTLLSGGQKQRLTIARALLKDPEILIFDEATSSLDQESERMIQQAIQELHGAKTLIIVSHRLSLLKYVDQVLLIDKQNVSPVSKDYVTERVM